MLASCALLLCLVRCTLLKQCGFSGGSPSVRSPCGPRRTLLLGLHGDSAEGFLLEGLYCLEFIAVIVRMCIHTYVYGYICEFYLLCICISNCTLFFIVNFSVDSGDGSVFD